MATHKFERNWVNNLNRFGWVMLIVSLFVAQASLIAGQETLTGFLGSGVGVLIIYLSGLIDLRLRS